jgi:hypothetical protein
MINRAFSFEIGLLNKRHQGVLFLCFQYYLLRTIVLVCSKLYPAGTKPLRRNYEESNKEIILKHEEKVQGKNLKTICIC